MQVKIPGENYKIRALCAGGGGGGGGGGGCRYFFDGTYADFSKFLKITTHPPPSRME